MAKLTIDGLRRLREEARKGIYLREGEFKGRITIHMGTCGIAAGARAIVSAFLRVLEKSGRKDVIVTTSGCAGLCSREPMATVEMSGQAPVKYGDLTPERAERIFAEHILRGEVVAEYALGIGSERGG